MLKLILILISVLLFTCNKKEKLNLPLVEKGLIDLSNWDFEKEAKLDLDGEWLFSYNNLVFYPKDNKDLEKFNFVNVPSSWTNYTLSNNKLPSFGYGTYSVKIMLPRTRSSLVLKIYDLGTAYEIYENKNLIGSKGKVGTSSDTSQSLLVSDLYEIDASNDILYLTFHISNYSHSRAGMWRSLSIGKRNYFLKEREIIIALDLFLIGFFFLMSIYNLSLYFFRPKDKTLLYFSIFSIILSVRIFITGEKFIYSIFPDLSFNLIITLEYLTFITAPFIFNLFFYHLFPESTNKKINLLFKFIFFLYGILIILTPLHFYSSLVIYMQVSIILFIIYIIAVTINAFLKKADGSLIFGFGSVFISGAIILDIFVLRNIISVNPLSPIGFVVFTFCIAIILSKKFSMGFILAEDLAKSLEISNKDLNNLKLNLESEVIDRTIELLQLNEFSKKINSMESLSEIISEVEKFLWDRFEISSFFYMLYDHESKELFTYDYHFSLELDEIYINLIKNLRIINKKNLLLELKNNKNPFLYSSIPKELFADEINYTLINEIENKIGTFTIFPLVINDTLVGTLNIASNIYSSNLQDRQFQSLIRFIDQFIGAVKVSTLTNKALTVQEKMAKIGGVASEIIHDLKNPLSAIKLYAELSLSDNISYEKRSEYMNTISSEIDRLSNITQEILDFVKDKFTIEKEQVDLKPFLESIYKFLSPDLEHKEISLNMEINYTGILYIDRDRIKRCILNLIYNSIDSLDVVTDNRIKNINLKVYEKDNSIFFEIEDNGCGIPDDIQKYIFLNFFSHGKNRGTGIGLYLTKNIIKDHNGEIEFKSYLNIGTMFRFYLPL
jgi:signal transduction histidine kinase